MTTEKKSSYAASGVSIDAGNKAVEMMAAAVRLTYDKRVLAGIGSFGGVFDVSALQRMAAPALDAITEFA